MSTTTAQSGSILWQDLTVGNAGDVSRFYAEVVGWEASPHDMGEYHDFNMKDGEGKIVAGICHAKGSNANIPPQWILYISVEDVEASAARCRELGGEVVDGPRTVGESRFCIIRDPAGAVAGLYGG